MIHFLLMLTHSSDGAIGLVDLLLELGYLRLYLAIQS